MNINDSIKSKAGITADKTQLEKPTAKPAQTATGAAAPAVAGESVTLSSLSAQVKSFEAEASAGVFDAEKVQAIKSAISSGQFKVDSEKVADGLIPVSYTHLDVYKRQVNATALAPVVGTKLTVGVAGAMVGATPVSYTHLLNGCIFIIAGEL